MAPKQDLSWHCSLILRLWGGCSSGGRAGHLLTTTAFYLWLYRISFSKKSEKSKKRLLEFWEVSRLSLARFPRHKMSMRICISDSRHCLLLFVTIHVLREKRFLHFKTLGSLSLKDQWCLAKFLCFCFIAGSKSTNPNDSTWFKYTCMVWPCLNTSIILFLHILNCGKPIKVFQLAEASFIATLIYWLLTDCLD